MASEATQQNGQRLEKGLKNRHLSMIAIGGVIGAGLFVGSGAAINEAGPGVIVSYALTGALVVLVMRMLGEMAAAHPDKRITFLDRTVCYCSTMNRIDLPHLVWALESLVAGTEVNVIRVDRDTEHFAQVALQRMLDLPGKSHRD